MVDSYKIFMEEFEIDEDKLMLFGLDNSIFIDKDKAKAEWEKLKEDNRAVSRCICTNLW